MSEAHVLQDLVKSVKAMQNDLGKIKTDMGTVKRDVAGMKTEMGKVKRDVAGMKTEMGEVKRDVAGMRTEMRTGFARLETSISVVYVFTSLEAGLTSMHSDYNSRARLHNSNPSSSTLALEGLR